MTQLPLSLVLPDEADIKDFFVTQANQLAFGWIEKWPDWPAPYQSVNIYGPKGCGKSHLGALFGAKLHCKTLTSLTEFDRDLLASFDGYILDSVSMEAAWDEIALFHFFNYLSETGKSAYITSVEALSQMPWRLPDLASRIRAIAAQKVDMPDDDLLAALLDSYFANRQCQVAEPVMRYILARVDRSYEAVAELARAIDHISLAEKKPVTIALIKELFQSSDDQ
ncbi:MAG: HdaA/DnaA family protein [Candidatus Puniceispirillaceae bacterium]